MSHETNNLDVIIIGGGPAGMSAAIRCAELGIDAILLEREAELGGQLLWTYNAIENYTPFPAKNGRELCDHFIQRVENAGAKYVINAAIDKVDLMQKLITLHNGDQYSANSIIIATGIRRRLLNVPGEKELRGRGILESGIKDKEQVRGKTVVIIGGGDAAIENACILSEVAQKVVVVHRRNKFTAQSRFVDTVSRLPNVEIMFGSRVVAILGEVSVAGVKIQNVDCEDHSTIDTDAVLIRIGVEPNIELFTDQIAIDNARFISSKNLCLTTVPGVYVAGDVANPNNLTVAAATTVGTESAQRTKI